MRAAGDPRALAPTLLRLAALVPLLAAAALAAAPAPASVAAPVEWRLEQPPPPSQPGVGGSETPIGLGKVGDVQFLSPDLGLLITAGNGKTIKPGLWAYNGSGWHQLSIVCGATDGRIAWAGPEEFWTVSDGRPGQAPNGTTKLPPLEDNTLCHFAGGSVVKSFASLAFSSSSYQPMNAAVCVNPSDCWFAGAPLPPPQPGAFQLHWNGGGVAAEPNIRAEAIGAMQLFEGRPVESVALPLNPPTEGQTIEEILHPTVLYGISPEGVVPQFKAVRALSGKGKLLPEYFKEAGGEAFPATLSALQLSAGESSLWAAAGPTLQVPSGSLPGKLTVLRESDGVWSQVLGAEGPEKESRAIVPPTIAEDVVNSVAAEPGTASAWLALDTPHDTSPTAEALLVHVQADGTLTQEELPTKQQREAGIEPKGAAATVTCPAQNDCWVATTQGWLFHLSEAGHETLPLNPDPALNGPLITFRPLDEGLPQVPPDTVPVDNSGLGEAPPLTTTLTAPESKFATVPVPLISGLRSRLRRGGTTLELSFRLAVRARIRLVARRHKSVVASTPTRTLSAGRHTLLLVLNRHRWPTKLELQEHPLAPLPTRSTREASVESVGTSLRAPGPAAPGLLGSGTWR